MYRGDIRLGDTIDLKFTTRSFTTGAPTTLAGTPVISAYVGNSVTQITAGITLTVDFDGVTGLHNIRVVATSGNGYATASNYDLVITTGTVGGVSVVGEVVGSFSIEARSAVMPTTAARTLDVSAGGEAGLDWANIGSPTTAQNLSATNIDVDQVVASVSGAVGSVTGAVGSVAAGGITAASIATGAIDADALAADAGTEIAAAVWDLDATLHQTQGTFGQAIGDPVADTNTIFKAVVTDATGATVGVDVVAVKAETASIQTDANDIQARLPAALVGGRVDASVGAVAADAITAAAIANGAIDAATFAAGAIDAAAIATGAIDADAIAADAVTEIRSVVSGTADSGTTTTMVDAARTEADTDYWKDMAVLFTSGAISGQARLITAFAPATDTITFSPATTQAVGTNTYEIIPNVAAAGASAPTAAEVADAVWDEAASGHLTAGTFGVQCGTDIDSILVNTAEIGGGGAGLTALATQASVNTIDDFLDTEIAAIKAKTDNLPASPAAVGDAMTLTAAYDFAKGTAAMAESYAANAAAPTPVQALFGIHQMLMDFSIAGTSLTVKKLDNTATAFVVTLNDATNPTATART